MRPTEIDRSELGTLQLQSRESSNDEWSTLRTQKFDSIKTKVDAVKYLEEQANGWRRTDSHRNRQFQIVSLAQSGRVFVIETVLHNIV